MNNTILITGTSSGYGKATADLFLERAGMWWPRCAARSGGFGLIDRLRILPLDVTSQDSIAALVEAAGPVDVLVNNAGVGGVGAFEAMPMSLIRQLIETNTIGVMAMCQAFIPHMRERRAGCIVNVTSSVTLGRFRWRRPIRPPSRRSRALPLRWRTNLAISAFGQNWSSRGMPPPRASGPMRLCR
jgi:NAD(P)-dependent dehydrogenase (short-subunit alcohol dehydrogenase family)